MPNAKDVKDGKEIVESSETLGAMAPVGYAGFNAPAKRAIPTTAAQDAQLAKVLKERALGT